VREEEVVCSYISQIKKDHEHACSQVFVVCVLFGLTKKNSSSFQFFSKTDDDDDDDALI
jgi:hypothetical protein